ncbi:MAG TPA: amidophosphoribosyltransferase, partial [Caulobacterales bacterium]|nr:amidophosphoribosyltransferase [Caulobacterales bacterium]
SIPEMTKALGVDSLGFLSVDGLYKAMGEAGRDDANPQFTDHCFTGEYPTVLTDHKADRASKDLQLSFLVEA